MNWIKDMNYIGLKMAISYLTLCPLRMSSKGHGFSLTIWEGRSMIDDSIDQWKCRKDDEACASGPKPCEDGSFHLLSLGTFTLGCLRVHIRSWVACRTNHRGSPWDYTEGEKLCWAHPSHCLHECQKPVWRLLGSYKPSAKDGQRAKWEER